jgi:hypothetical protein
MVLVALVALDLGAIRALLGTEVGTFLLLGGLPMANVLVVGLLIGQRRPGSRPFLLGFEACGVLALVSYINLTCSLPDSSYEPIGSYLTPWLELMDKLIGRNQPFLFVPIACFGVVIMLGLPQLAFALLGGLLSRQYRLILTRRPA